MWPTACCFTEAEHKWCLNSIKLNTQSNQYKNGPYKQFVSAALKQAIQHICCAMPLSSSAWKRHCTTHLHVATFQGLTTLMYCLHDCKGQVASTCKQSRRIAGVMIMSMHYWLEPLTCSTQCNQTTLAAASCIPGTKFRNLNAMHADTATRDGMSLPVSQGSLSRPLKFATLLYMDA